MNGLLYYLLGRRIGDDIMDCVQSVRDWRLIAKLEAQAEREEMANLRIQELEEMVLGGNHTGDR